MSFFTRFSLKNAVAVLIISALLIAGGVYSFSKLKVDLFPNIEFPIVSVEFIYPGASPTDIDTEVISKVESQLKGIEGVKSMTSSIAENVGFINLEFPFDTDLDKVERQVDTIIKEAKIPDNAESAVNRFSFSMMPIYNISLFAKGDTNLQAFLNDTVIPELKKVNGVNSVSVGGKKAELLEITVDKDKLGQAGLSLSQVKEQINEKFLSFPVGAMTSNSMKIPVRVQEKIETIDKLKNLPLSSPIPNAKPVKLSDVAIIETITKQTDLTRYNLKESLSMAITKKQDANTVEISEKVIEVLDKYSDKMSYAIGLDSAKEIKSSVDTLMREGLLGALFASLAVLIFLRNFRATIIAIISIPMSLLISTIFLHQLDISLNMMTLGGMAVAVGRVVDDSIVVIENIFRRIRKSKDGLNNELILDSTKEILQAITSSTITTVVVFLPLGLVGGLTGKFFMPFALTIVFSLLASLLVAITIVPILARFSFTKVPPDEKEGTLQLTYAKAITWSLRHKAIVLVSSIALLVGSFAIVPSLGFTFIPNEELKTFTASIQLPAATTLEKTNETSLKVEQMLDKEPEIAEVTASIGGRDPATYVPSESQSNYFINVKEGTKLTEYLATLGKKIEDIAGNGAKVSLQELQNGPPSNSNVTIDLYSTDLDALQKSAKEVEEYLQKRDDLKYVTNNFSEKQKQLIVNIDPEKAAKYGVSGFQILGTIADQTKAVDMGILKLDGKERTVQLAYNKDVTSKKQLEDTMIFTKLGPVKVTEMATIEEANIFTSIQKNDGKVFAQVTGQVIGNDVQATTTKVIEAVKNDIKLPSNVSFEGGGGSDETMEMFQQLAMAMAIAVGLVYITMLVAFGKARIPFIILSSLIFVPIGSLLGLFLAGEPMSVSVMIGLLMLIGIVTTNAIVLVDRIGQNREKKGMKIHDALVEAGKTRLRPILMTAFATIAALIPLALSSSSGTLISKGLAITVIGGLTSSTLLTLIIIPVVYELFFFRQVKKERLK